MNVDKGSSVDLSTHLKRILVTCVHLRCISKYDSFSLYFFCYICLAILRMTWVSTKQASLCQVRAAYDK